MKPNLALLYLGAFTPDFPEFQNPATSTAGNLFQQNFLTALARSTLPNPTVFTYFPIASFPKVKTLFVGSRQVRLGNGLRATSLPHINLGPIKILTLGLSAAWNTLRWGIAHRACPRRVVVCYNLTAPPAWPISLVCRLLKMDLAPFIGDIYVPGEVVDNTWLRRLEFAAQKRVIPRAQGLLVANQAIIDDFAPGRHALLIEGGVMEDDIRRFAAPSPSAEGLFHVVFAGQLSELNGVNLLLDAMRLIEDPNLRVTILGGGEWAHEVRRAVAKDARIRYRGRVSHDEVLEVYGEADLLLNLRRTHYRTHRYVFPSKVVECLATGRPLLTTSTGHVESEFGEFVFKLEVETPEALAAALTNLAAMDPELRLAPARRAREYVLAHKTWEAQCRKLENYLETEVFKGAAA